MSAPKDRGKDPARQIWKAADKHVRGYASGYRSTEPKVSPRGEGVIRAPRPAVTPTDPYVSPTPKAAEAREKAKRIDPDRFNGEI